MIFSIKFLQVFDKYKGAGAGAAIRNFGSSAPAPQHCLVDNCTDDYTIKPADSIGLVSCLSTILFLSCNTQVCAYVLRILIRMDRHNSPPYPHFVNGTDRMIIPLSQLTELA
jgi:hypothetical protein